MTLADLFQMYFDRANAYQWYWTLYVVIVGGLLAFSSLRVRQDLITLLLITALFSIFAYKNGSAILDVLKQRNAMVEAIRQVSNLADGNEAKEKMVATLVELKPEDVRNFHITSDVLVIVTLWAFELRRWRQARELRKSTLEPRTV